MAKTRPNSRKEAHHAPSSPAVTPSLLKHGARSHLKLSSAASRSLSPEVNSAPNQSLYNRQLPPAIHEPTIAELLGSSSSPPSPPLSSPPTGPSNTLNLPDDISREMGEFSMIPIRSQNPDLQQREELQRLQSKMDFIAEQQATHSKYMDFIVQTLCKDGFPSTSTAPPNIKSKPETKVSNKVPSTIKRHLRDKGLEASPSSSGNTDQQARLADFLGGEKEDQSNTKGFTMEQRANPSLESGTSDPKGLQERVAWKWRWAAAEWKARELSQKIKDLQKNEKEDKKTNNAPNMRDRGIKNVRGPKSAPLDVINTESSNSSNMNNHGNLQKQDNGGPLCRVQGLEKQVSQLHACLGKMMPTLIVLVEKAGNKKLADSCFAEWRAFHSNMNASQDESRDNHPSSGAGLQDGIVDDNEHDCDAETCIKPSTNTARSGIVETGRANHRRETKNKIRPLFHDGKGSCGSLLTKSSPPNSCSNPKLHQLSTKQQHTREATINPGADLQPNFSSNKLRRTFAVPSLAQGTQKYVNCTSKALHALQLSLRQELNELQGLLRSEMDALVKQDCFDSDAKMKRGGGRGEHVPWRHALTGVWELCSSVAILLNHARSRFRSEGRVAPDLRFLLGRRPPPPPRPPAARPPRRKPLVLRIPAQESPVKSSPTGPSPSRPVFLRISSPAPCLGPDPGNGPSCSSQPLEVQLTPSAARRSRCRFRIKASPPPRPPTHANALQEWHGRPCLAAQHAASLRRNIDRLRTRHQLASSRLQQHQHDHPLPIKLSWQQPDIDAYSP